jgi:hypothetical protein
MKVIVGECWVNSGFSSSKYIHKLNIRDKYKQERYWFF